MAAIVLIIIIGAPVIGILLWIKAFGGEDGERLQKMRMQGPFVPVDDEEPKN